jgi:hypothetical protein
VIPKFFGGFSLVAALILSFTALPAHADYYQCAKKVYEAGWLKKYQYKGETWAANTKKSGLLSSTMNVSTENTTSSVDPGVTTGQGSATLHRDFKAIPRRLH